MENYAEIVHRQRQFFNSGQTRVPKFRKEQLRKLRDLIQKYEKDLEAALLKDFRKPPFETYLSESGYMILEINDFIKKVGRWTRPHKLTDNLLSFPASSYLIYEPYGVALIISPWNYPFQLAMGPLSGAIVAGNCAILKPSEITPHTSAFMASLINDNFEDHYLHVIEGGAETNQELLKLRFDYIFYTGGIRVGKIIAASAARNLTPNTLELGGKSPCFVDGTMNMKLAARRIVWGKFVNNGQTCVAPDYIYVHREAREQLLQHLKQEIIRSFGEDPGKSPDLARIVNLTHFERLRKMIPPEKVYFGGEYNAKDLYIAPTLLKDVTWEDEVMQEEIFGPILPVLSYDDIAETIRYLKTREKPLALYVFSTNKKYTSHILAELSFGGGVINDTVVHYGNPHIPFGGVGASGYGAYHGKYSFETFSHKKGILRKGNWLDVPVRYAPYTSGKMKWLKRLFRLNFEW